MVRGRRARRGPHRRRARATGSAASAVGARIFRDEVAQGRAEKETELRERLGLVPHGPPSWTAAGTGAGPEHDTTRTDVTTQEGST